MGNMNDILSMNSQQHILNRSNTEMMALIEVSWGREYI